MDRISSYQCTDINVIRLGLRLGLGQPGRLDRTQCDLRSRDMHSSFRGCGRYSSLGPYLCSNFIKDELACCSWRRQHYDRE